MKPSTIPKDNLFGAQSLQLTLTAYIFSCLRLACYITATCPRLDTKYAGSAFFLQHLQLLAERHFRGAPFLNFDFDAKDMMTVWFVGHPILSNIIDRVAYTALATRIQFRCQIRPITERDSFTQLIQHAFKETGCQTNLLSDSGIEIIRIASGGRPRNVHLILSNTMQLAMQKKLNHLPDELIQESIDMLKG
jgi:MSHA biogenesis protein MshM